MRLGYVGAMPRKPRKPDPDGAGGLIKAWREFRGISQPKLGEMIGSTKDQLSRWEANIHPIPLKTALQIADALGIKPWQLVLAPDEPVEVLTGELARIAAILRGLSDTDLQILAQTAERFPQKDHGTLQPDRPA